MYGVTWPQIRNLLQMVLTGAGGFLAGKYPTVDWPLIGSIVMSAAGIIWTVRTGQKDIMLTDVAQLQSSNGVSLVTKVSINPTAPEATAIVDATPANVQVSKAL